MSHMSFLIAPFMKSGEKEVSPVSRIAPAILPFLMLFFFSLPGCGSTKGRIVDMQGRPSAELNYLWEEVDRIFPGALPDQVTLVFTERDYSGFDEKKNSVILSRNFLPSVIPGKICLGLTHLALHRMSGGDNQNPGRCFDNDIRFLEFTVALYMEYRVRDDFEKELEKAYGLAAHLFEEKSLSLLDLRDWNSFYYRGLWTDESGEWNLEGGKALLTLGRYFLERWPFSRIGEIFELLGDREMTLEDAVREALDIEVTEIFEGWKEDVLERASRIRNPPGSSKEKES